MSGSEQSYSIGDWIVHGHYGIGQIKAIEIKDISGEETQYFRIETSDSIFWMPVDQMDNEILRPLSTTEEIEQVIDVLQRPPREMDSNHVRRKSRIRRVTGDNIPLGIARLIRDLRGRRREGELNTTESSALRDLTKRLVREWAIVMGVQTEIAKARLDSLLRRQRQSEEQSGAAVPPAPESQTEARQTISR